MNLVSYMVRGRDIFVAALAGLLIGFLSLPILLNLNLAGVLGDSWLKIIAFVFTFGILGAAGMLIARSLGQHFPILLQIAKFILVGGLNTLVDLGVLNVLILVTDVAVGPFYVVFKSISFVAAVSNSYIWNKYWTFQSKNNDSKEVVQFFVVSLIGFLINVGFASAIVSWVSIVGVSPKLMANLGALTGTFAGLAWNFIGYKFIVFKKSSS
jgi:putative flippase GtrA